MHPANLARVCALALTVFVGQPASADNSCVFAFDGDCDDGSPGAFSNLCTPGTDDSDCGIPASSGGGGGLLNPCPFTNDGDCDEPDGLNLCAWGTDVNDCSSPTTNFGNNPNPNPSASPAPNTPRAPAIPSTAQGIQIQTALNYFGFNAGFVDGQIGPGTMAAIRLFQTNLGYPATGTLAPDQLSFLLSAYTWATTQGGAVQTGQVGAPLLLAYRNSLLAPVAPLPVAPAPAVPVAPLVPQVAAPVTPTPAPAFPSLGGGNAATCPTPQNSDGLILNFASSNRQVFLNSDGQSGEFEVGVDFAFATYYMPIGLLTLGFDTGPSGAELPNTRFSNTYVGAPGQAAVPPAPTPGVTWNGTANEVDIDGSTTQYTIEVAVGQPALQAFAGCAYSILPITVRRSVNGSSNTEYFFHLVDFGVTLFFGQADTDGTPILDEPIGVELRGDDGL